MTAVASDPARTPRGSHRVITGVGSAGLAEPGDAARHWPVPGRSSDARTIQALDPLHGDEPLARLREMNARADTGALLTLAADLVPSEPLVGALSVAECIAAMRDLGIVAGSLKRHGVDPISALPALGTAMTALGRRTGMVARETVYHYTEWNPPGDRRRMYTGDPQECALQDSVTRCLPDLGAAVDHCRELKAIAPADTEFAERGMKLAWHVGRLVRTIDLVRARVSPEFFARGLRPYFEEIAVGGEVLLGPAAAHIPVGLIDLALWASDCDGERYAGFCAESARYNPPVWRRLYAEWATSPSLVTRVLEASRSGAASCRADLGAEALRDTLRAIVVFRGRHLGLARKAYADQVRLYALGSGGGSLDLLSEIVSLTRRNARCLEGLARDA